MTTTKSRTAKKTVAAPKRVVRTPKKSSAPELNAYVPDPRIADRYVGRKVFGVWDATVATIARNTAKNILLMGDTGAGKTMFGEAYASKFGLPYYSLPCDVSIDPTAIFGRMQPTSVVGKYEWQDGPATEIVRNGGVFNISEGNFMTPKIAASLFPLLDGRRYIPLLGHRGEVVRAHLGGGRLGGKCWCDLKKVECDKKLVLVIMDLNPNYRGTIELNAAFLNRFDFKIPWGYDTAVEEKLVNFPTVREIARKLREMYGTEVQTPVSTNMLMEFEEFATNPELGTTFATLNFVAAFRSDEQDSVRRMIELEDENIQKDMRFHARNKGRRGDAVVEDDDDLEEVEVEFEEDDDE